MAATGEQYSTARRAVRAGPDRPAPLARPPAIDPQEHAVHSRRWGVHACYLACYQGRYSAWITGTDPGDRSQVYEMASEPAGRVFVDAWPAVNLLHPPWDERIATIFLLSRSTRNGILYEAAVVDVKDSGIWLACAGLDEPDREPSHLGRLRRRTRDPDDRRKVLFSTTEGDELASAARAQRNAWLDQRLRALSAEDRAVIARATVLLSGIADS